MIKRKAEKNLKCIPSCDREKIATNILALSMDDINKNLDIKKLKNSNNFRLRVGDWRVIYAKDYNLKTLYILDINHRREVYK